VGHFDISRLDTRCLNEGAARRTGCLGYAVARELDTKSGVFLIIPKRVFVVDDDPGMLRTIERLLRRHGYETVLFEIAEAFENQRDFRDALCVILDINLGGRSGIDSRKRLKETGHAVPVIYMTGNDDPGVRNAALESGCIAYLLEPLSARPLVGALERASAIAEPLWRRASKGL